MIQSEEKIKERSGMSQETLNHITASNTPEYGEVSIVPPTAEMSEREKMNHFEVVAKLDGHPVDMPLNDLLTQTHVDGYGPYKMRLVQGDKAYAIALLRDGLSIVDIEAMKAAKADLQDRPANDDPIEGSFNRGKESLMAHDMSTSRLEEGGELSLGDDKQNVVLTLNQGIIHFEANGDEQSDTTLYYGQYPTESVDYQGPLSRGAIESAVVFDAFRAQIEKRQQKQ